MYFYLETVLGNKFICSADETAKAIKGEEFRSIWRNVLGGGWTNNLNPSTNKLFNNVKIVKPVNYNPIAITDQSPLPPGVTFK